MYRLQYREESIRQWVIIDIINWSSFIFSSASYTLITMPLHLDYVTVFSFSYFDTSLENVLCNRYF